MKFLQLSAFIGVAILTSCATDHGRQTFRKLDADRDGKVSVPEFSSHLGGESFRLLDRDADGMVSAAEWTEKESAATSASLFRSLDANGDNCLQRSEFAAPTGSKRYAEIEGVFHTLDRNHDGALEWEEISY